MLLRKESVPLDPSMPSNMPTSSYRAAHPGAVPAGARAWPDAELSRPPRETRKVRWKASLAWLLRSSITFFAFLLLTALVVIGWIGSTQGREWMASRLEESIRKEIRGGVDIGLITDVDGQGVSASNITFISPSGHRVLYARDVHLVVDWPAFFRGRFHASKGEIRGGTLWLSTNDHGELDLDLAFRSSDRSRGLRRDTVDPIRIERLAVSGVDVVTKVEGVPDAEIKDLSAIMSLVVPKPGAPVRLRADRLRGQLRAQTPIPLHLRMQSGTLRFDGAARQRAVVSARGVLDGEPVRISTRVTETQAKTQVRLVLGVKDAGAWMRSLPAVAQGTIAGLRETNFDFDVVFD